jgi:lanthanide-dependent methanol dehydrogenase
MKIVDKRWFQTMLAMTWLLAFPASTWANADLEKMIANPNNWAMQAGDMYNHRYSNLSQINAKNVGKLQVAWMFSTGVLRGHEGSPLVMNGTMYLHTPFPNKVFAIDLDTQKIKWRYEPKQDAAVIPQMCCDTVYRGLAYAENKIFLQQADSMLVALDANTGKVLWSVKNGDPKVGAVNTNAPHVFKDKVITGISGGEWGVRGYITAYDINSGKQVWRAYSMGPDDEMLVNPEKTMTWTDGAMKPVGKDSSLKTWQAEQWKNGGGTTWGWYSYDKGLNLLYYGSGNPSTWNPAQRPGDNKWSMAIWARDVDTGEAKWVYQMTPWDQWDYDGINEMILADINVKGKPTKALVHFDRNGFGYTLDRTTGALLVAEKYDPAVNWATKVDMKTGRPEVVKKYAPGENGTDVNNKGICPAALGSKDEQPAAFDPKTKRFYVPTNHVCMDYEPFKVEYTAGQPYVGATLSMFPAPGGTNMGRRHGQDRADEGREVLGVERPPRHRGRDRLLRHARGLSQVRRCEQHQQGALQLQDAVGDHRQRLHLSAQGQAVHGRVLGNRRLGRNRHGGGPREGSGGTRCRRGLQGTSRLHQPRRFADRIRASNVISRPSPGCPRGHAGDDVPPWNGVATLSR